MVPLIYVVLSEYVGERDFTWFTDRWDAQEYMLNEFEVGDHNARLVSWELSVSPEDDDQVKQELEVNMVELLARKPLVEVTWGEEDQ